jgi:prevent-host-death family protein
MKPVSISVAKNTLSSLLKKVRRGQTITITDRGVPVARLVPPASTAGIPVKMIELAERGLVTLPEREPTDWFKGPLAKLTGKSGMTAVDALLDERRTGR